MGSIAISGSFVAFAFGALTVAAAVRAILALALQLLEGNIGMVRHMVLFLTLAFAALVGALAVMAFLQPSKAFAVVIGIELLAAGACIVHAAAVAPAAPTKSWQRTVGVAVAAALTVGLATPKLHVSYSKSRSTSRTPIASVKNGNDVSTFRPCSRDLITHMSDCGPNGPVSHLILG